MSLKEQLNQTKPQQESLRTIQQKRDRGLTFGSDNKHPCKKVNYFFIYANFEWLYYNI